MALKKICPKCHKIIANNTTYCNDCTAKWLELKVETNRYYDNTYRDKEGKRFYNSKEWTAVTKMVKNRDYGLCKLCRSNNQTTFASIVHHIVERKEDKSKALDPFNCISLCTGCHNHIHNEYKKNSQAKATMQERLNSLIRVD